MTRRSKRELERDLERLDGGEPSRAERWRQYITGEITPEEYNELRAGGSA